MKGHHRNSEDDNCLLLDAGYGMIVTIQQHASEPVTRLDTVSKG
jgi:hypothetical protein